MTDPRDIGTYNFYDPVSSRSLHWKYDVDPYEEWGNSYNDTTTNFQRGKIIWTISFGKWYYKDKTD